MSTRLNAAAGVLAAVGAGLLPAPAAAQTKLLRFPDIAGDRVAFCYAGDISTDFPLTVKGRITKRKLEGTVGSGGRMLEMKTVNGGIELKKSSGL